MKINHHNFQDPRVTMQVSGINADNTDLVDFGDLHLRLGDRNYQLTFGTVEGFITEDTMSVSLEIESLDICQETFPECDYQLTEDDLRNPELIATIFCDWSNIPDATVVLKRATIVYQFSPDERILIPVSFDK